MSEFINNSEKRLSDLLALSLGIMNGEDGKALIEKYRDAIDHMTPHDMLKMEEKQLQMGITPGEIKQEVEKVINVFTKSLNSYLWKKPSEGTFLYTLMLENEAFTFRLNRVKKILKGYRGMETEEFKRMKTELLPRFREFQAFEAHYVKKENILFPYLEEVWEYYRPLQVMWSLHDDIRRTLKEVIAMLEDDTSQWSDFNRLLGRYYSLVFRMIQKEDSIIFPVASETVNEPAWHEMMQQSFDYPFPFIDPPHKPVVHATETESQLLPEIPGSIVSETGRMTAEQALLVFNSLPVDITVVDEHDKVLYFNRGEDRLFPRSPAIVGRRVQNCHPPESVHVVEQIIEAFRNGERDHADFWITMRGRFVLIRYFALRNVDGSYKGVVEVSQDVTEIRELTGERRLLNWE